MWEVTFLGSGGYDVDIFGAVFQSSHGRRTWSVVMKQAQGSWERVQVEGAASSKVGAREGSGEERNESKSGSPKAW